MHQWLLLWKCITGHCLIVLLLQFLCYMLSAAMVLAFATLTHCTLPSIFACSADPLKKPEPWKLLGNAMSNSSLWLTEQMGNEEELE